MVRYAVQIALPGAPDQCVDADSRTIIADVIDDSHVKLGLQIVNLSDLDARLHEIYDFRALRVLFITANPELSFQKVAEVLDIAKRQIEAVAILTPSVEKQRCWIVRRPTAIEWISTGRKPQGL